MDRCKYFKYLYDSPLKMPQFSRRSLLAFTNQYHHRRRGRRKGMMCHLHHSCAPQLYFNVVYHSCTPQFYTSVLYLSCVPQLYTTILWPCQICVCMKCAGWAGELWRRVKKQPQLFIALPIHYIAFRCIFVRVSHSSVIFCWRAFKPVQKVGSRG